MVTIKQAAELTGVPEHTLRAWERRYGAFQAPRSAGGYRMYDEDAIRQIQQMHALVEMGVPPRAAWTEVARHGDDPVGAVTPALLDPDQVGRVISALVALDAATVRRIVAEQFALRDFESVVDGWLMPMLQQVGRAWADGRITVAGEHLMSNVVGRRLGAAYDAAALGSGGSTVILGAPSGILHDLGLMAFAVCLRRRGLATIYLGNDVPVDAWADAAASTGARTHVTAAYRRADGPRVAALAERLWRDVPDARIAVGGSYQRSAPEGCLLLGNRLAEGARTLAEVLA